MGLRANLTTDQRSRSLTGSPNLHLMIIGVPREIKQQENRVSLLPSEAYQLVKHGHRVLVESGAGAGSGYPDEDYAKAGATMLKEHAAVFAEADLIVKVKEPLPAEYALLRRGQLLFTYLHLAANRPLTDALAASGATCIAYETIEVNRRLPLLEPMSEIAGPHVDHRRRLFSGEACGRLGRALGRRAGGVAGKSGGDRRREFGGERG